MTTPKQPTELDRQAAKEIGDAVCTQIKHNYPGLAFAFEYGSWADMLARIYAPEREKARRMEEALRNLPLEAFRRKSMPLNMSEFIDHAGQFWEALAEARVALEK